MKLLLDQSLTHKTPDTLRRTNQCTLKPEEPLKRRFGPTQTELNNAYAANKLFKLWVNNKRVYGKVKLWEETKRQGWRIGRDQIHQLMKILNIKGVSRRKKVRTTITDPTTERFTDHIKRARKEAQHPGQW
ncbi:hypothetical protein BUE64_05115 [Corynebacterium diphtheriae subsp. lausannense]|nr:hypothetical protein BUE64_05115 [Corynebacterium diphtheriae subsp. lausannense]QBZ29840.1 hypothetical protein E4653_08350 [Corynebacterium diphtheriae subsp. lausannense]